jgi:hypothetical protein
VPDLPSSMPLRPVLYRLENHIYLDSQRRWKLAHEGPAHVHTIPSQTAFVSKAHIEYLDRGRMAHETLKAAANKKHQDIYSVFLRVRSLMAMSTASCSTRNRESPSQSQMQIGMFPCRRALSTDQMVVLASRQLECLHLPAWASHKCR